MNHRAHILVGLGFGDEGKGTMTDWFCRESKPNLVVRYNGGAQCGHNVITPEGKHHCFSQYGSGTLAGVDTLLSKFMMVNMYSLAHEAAYLAPLYPDKNPVDMVMIDGRAPILTPYHVMANQLKEFMRGNARHGSCGKGIGELGYDMVHHPDEVLHAMDLRDQDKTLDTLQRIRARKTHDLIMMGIGNLPMNHKLSQIFRKEFEERKGVEDAAILLKIANRYNILEPDRVNDLVRTSDVVMEGAQGVLLDEWKGFHPHTTWSNITVENAYAILTEARWSGEIETTGIIRAYATRHGAGPFPSHQDGMLKINPLEHNQRNDFQGSFRVGDFDFVLFDYACRCIPQLTNIAFTHADMVDRLTGVCWSYQFDNGKQLDTLQLSSGHDLSHQTTLNDTLTRVKALRTAPPSGGLDGLIDAVKTCANRPVAYISSGPTAHTKQRC